jgi:hypothetical protein
MDAGEPVENDALLPSPEMIGYYRREFNKLEDFLVKEFQFDYSLGEFTIDKAIDLLKRYKRLLMTTTLPL